MKSSAREIMNSPVICVDTKMLVSDLIKAFQVHGISFVPVFDEKGRLAGVVSDSDVVSKCGLFCNKVLSDLDLRKGPPSPDVTFSRGFHIEEYADQWVEEIMNKRVISARPETPVGEIVDLMLQNSIHRVVIVDEGRPVGIVSSLDLVSCLEERGN